jgi:hypothetical protein
MKPLILTMIVVVWGVLGWPDSPPVASFRLFGGDSVVPFTSVHTDRCQQDLMGRGSSGWLRTSGGAGGPYAVEIREAATRYGVDPDLVHSLIRVESDFNPRAVSRKGAQGLMQLMPQTAALLGVRNAFNPRQNIDGGVRHLRGLMNRYGGNLRLALAAYNAGEQAVAWYGGIPPYPETRQHIQRVLSHYGTASPGAIRRFLYWSVDSPGTMIDTKVLSTSPLFRS